jgi:hypothetical protein
MLTGLLEPKLKVGGYPAFVGLEVIAAVSAMLPIKSPVGVTVIVEVLPAVAPGDRVTGVPLRVKVGVTAGVIVSLRIFEVLAANSDVP